MVQTILVAMVLALVGRVLATRCLSDPIIHNTFLGDQNRLLQVSPRLLVLWNQERGDRGVSETDTLGCRRIRGKRSLRFREVAVSF
jgi:hypothetical protein